MGCNDLWVSTSLAANKHVKTGVSISNREPTATHHPKTPMFSVLFITLRLRTAAETRGLREELLEESQSSERLKRLAGDMSRKTSGNGEVATLNSTW